MDLGVSGLASGFDWRTFVDQMADVQRAPETRLRGEQSTLQSRNDAYGKLVAELGNLKTRVTELKSASLFEGRLASVGDGTVASASASAGALQGSFAFEFVQLATQSRRVGTANVGAGLNATNDVSGLVIGNAGWVSPVTAGTFTVNGKQVTVATTDTLQQVFDKIGAATGGTVTASYDAAQDRIRLATGGGEIVLGSGTDTSNFLQLARLNNNGTGSVTSAAALGGIRSSAALSAANFAVAIDDAGGAGKFKVNGVEISYTKADTVADVLRRINESKAGVTASYDSLNDRFTLTNSATGDVGMALEDVSGNFLAATGLSGGSLVRGRDLTYRVNGGDLLTSHSNTITAASSGIEGLSVTALTAGKSTTVTVSNDTAGIKTAIRGFIEAFNKVQSLIDTQTAVSTDSTGKVTAGVLAGERAAQDVGVDLRRLAYQQVTGLPGALTYLDGLGISTSGNDNQLTLKDEARLDAALAADPAGVRNLFTDSSNGIAVRMADFLEKVSGESGTLVQHQDNLTKQITGIDTQVADMERLVLAERQRMIGSFIAMEKAQAQMNQQLQYLNKRFGNG
jgi:flagellar hook-associated protein 2